MLTRTRDNAANLAIKLVQRLIDKHIIETTSDKAIKEVIERELQNLINVDEFDIQFKIAPLRTLTHDPNFVSLYLTQYIIENLIDHPKIQDIFGDDLEVYRAVDSVMSVVRPS